MDKMRSQRSEIAFKNGLGIEHPARKLASTTGINITLMTTDTSIAIYCDELNKATIGLSPHYVSV
jgi:hypothetical protein